MYKHGPKSYRFKETWMALPVRKTLGRHSAKLLFKSGVDPKVFEAIKKTVKDWPENNKHCTISWDEVSLTEHFDYCQTRDVIEGFTYMVRGINVSFKQPTGYFYTNGLKAFELVELIKLMIGAVLIPIHSVCDQISTNASAVNELVNPAHPSKQQTGELLSYKVNGLKIIHCFDVPHLIKTLRNNLEKKDLVHFISKRWGINDADNSDNIGSMQIASWDHISELYRMDLQSALRLLPKLTDEHLAPKKLKMRVSNATQIFSNTCGTVMLLFVQQQKLPEHFADTAQLLLFGNDLFDSLNGSDRHQDDSLKSAVKEDSIHFAFWKYALVELSKMYFVDKLTGVVNNRSSVLKKIESTIRGYMEFSKICFELDIPKIFIRYRV